jgi:hypothetical protein
LARTELFLAAFLANQISLARVMVSWIFSFGARGDSGGTSTLPPAPLMVRKPKERSAGIEIQSEIILAEGIGGALNTGEKLRWA